jgi:hypothetical protein
MDKAFAYGAKDCRFESCVGNSFFCFVIRLKDAPASLQRRALIFSEKDVLLGPWDHFP